MVKKLFLVCLVAMMSVAPAFAAGTALDFKRTVPYGFDDDLTLAMMKVDSNKKKYPPGQTPPLEFLDTLNRAFDMIGLDYSGSVEKTLDRASSQDLMRLNRNGLMNILFIPIMYTEEKGMLDEAIEKGFLTNQAATLACRAGNIMGRKCEWKATTLDKYLGEYTYISDMCSGELSFSKTQMSGYAVGVATRCESGETCGAFFAITPSSERNGVVTLINVESGITFAVSANGITVDNVPTGICGMGAYMHGDYVRGKKTAGTQKTQAPQPPQEVIVCGTAKDEKAVSEELATVFFTELGSQDGYKRKFKDGQVTFFYNDHAPADEGYAPCNELVGKSRKRGLMFCFTLTSQPTPPVLKQAGVKEDTIFWGDNCGLPN